MASKLKPQKTRNTYHRAERKRKADEAEARRQAAAKRSPREQLGRLDALLGVGVGAKKERARLQARIEAAAAPKKR